jgi:hypothetical protein
MADVTPITRVLDVDGTVLHDCKASGCLVSWDGYVIATGERVEGGGHSGLTGLRLAVAHSPVIPRTEGAWIIGNDEKITWDVTGYPSTGAWSVFGYNTDAFAHSFHLRFLIAEIDRMTAALPATPAQTPELA